MKLQALENPSHAMRQDCRMFARSGKRLHLVLPRLSVDHVMTGTNCSAAIWMKCTDRCVTT
jgi:hypothetical protein